MKVSRLFLGAMLCAATTSFAQQASEDVVLKAMQDEIAQNMSGLKLPDFEKPFFMLYGVLDQKNYTYSATLGSLTRSFENQNRYKSTTRVLVGDYPFNDESLDDDLFSQSTSNEIDIPLENDYWGIRRSFWSTTDKVYRDAARNLEKNKETLKESGKSLESVPHRTFAKLPPVSLVVSTKPYQPNKLLLEQKVRGLSALFLKHPSIINSGVVINYVEGIRHMVSSEGSVIKVPFRVANFMCIAFAKTNEGEQALNGISHFATDPDKLPDDAQLTSEIETMIQQLENQAKLSKFSDDYSGPVLLVGQPVADVFSTALFNGNADIMANDNIPKLSGYQYDNEYFGNDSKLGKSILNEAISVTVKPKLKTFNGVDLLGSYDVDSEGVVPANVNVVERGVLKALLNNRTITSPTQTANGFANGPGVVQISVAMKDSEKSLKKKLIDKAKKQGLEFAILVRSNGSGIRQPGIYKVHVADGNEELVKGASLGKMDGKVLKKLSGASEKYMAYNLGGFNNGPREGTGMTSYIVPESILIDEMDVSRFALPSVKETEYVKNPLE
ncbi:MAG: hypothetical protein JSS79_17355 [Bacteroidetes bacterium]|nr:hypothetical protein [Bacteroidota bacterium]